MAARSQNRVRRLVGIDWGFVEPPPEHLIQSECPVCRQIIRDPYQVTCCGNKFCHSCIQRIKADNKPCPICQAKQINAFPDVGLKRSLYSFKVLCSNQKDGCEWTGELGQLDTHLNTDPQPERRHEGCPVTTISCDFLHVGCAVKLPRKDMPEHLRENFLTHISLLATSHARQQAQIASLVAENNQLKSKNTNLEHNLLSHATNFAAKSQYKPSTNPTQATKPAPSLEVVPRTTIPLGPPVLTMTNFQQHKRDGDYWYSSPVYTHHQGYKMCLAVVANGFGPGKGTHAAVAVHIMRGEFDDSLKWPFRGVISYRVLDQNKAKNHKTRSTTYNDTVDDKVCSRVTGREVALNGRGRPKFIAHTELEPTYLHNDTLLLQVFNVKLL